MSIEYFREKGNYYKDLIERKDIYVALLIILVGGAGFGFGRLSHVDTIKPPVTIEQAFPQNVLGASVSVPIAPDTDTKHSDVSRVQHTQGAYIGSRNGTKYHLPWCSGAQRIKEENKVWFASKEDAEALGYTPAANCKGL